jgi:hypothetical protein
MGKTDQHRALLRNKHRARLCKTDQSKKIMPGPDSAMGRGAYFSVAIQLLPSPAPSQAPACPACSSRALVFSVGGDGARQQPSLACIKQHTCSAARFTAGRFPFRLGRKPASPGISPVGQRMRYETGKANWPHALADATSAHLSWRLS